MTGPAGAGGDAARNERLRVAMGAHQTGRLAEAESLYLGLLGDDPGDADALHFFGLLRYQQQAVEEGERLIRASLACAPENPHAWNNLGNLLFASDRHDDAVEAYLRAVELDIELGAPWKNLGECLERSASPERAVALFRRIIESVPGFVPAYDALGRVLRVFGRHEEAVDVYRRWLELEPERPTARHMLAALSRNHVPERAADAYVVELFDAFADDFDDKLARLDYRAPELVVRRVEALLGPPAGRLRVLDTGCGTGLCGPLLRPYAAQLIGVDLSSGMIARAARRGCYDELATAELTDFLARRTADLDLMVSADTLCYFGALETVFRNARQALTPGSWFVFTLEAWREASASAAYRVEPHGRYVHGADYVCRCLLGAGFAAPSIEPVVLRKEVFEDVPGWLVAGQVPA